MRITDEMEDAVRLLEAEHPDLDIRACIRRLHANDFAALVLEMFVAQVNRTY